MDATNPKEVAEPQPLASSVVSKHPSKTGGFANQVVRMQLVDIGGEHSIVTDLDSELNLPYLSQPPQESLPKDVVRILLERTPLLTRQEKGHAVCIGNIRLYRLALVILGPSEFVPTIEHSGALTADRIERLRQGLLAETFLLPAVYGRRAPELKALRAAWERAAEAKMLEFWPCKGFAGLYGEDAVPPKKKRAPRRG